MSCHAPQPTFAQIADFFFIASQFIQQMPPAPPTISDSMGARSNKTITSILCVIINVFDYMKTLLRLLEYQLTFSIHHYRFGCVQIKYIRPCVIAKVYILHLCTGINHSYDRISYIINYICPSAIFDALRIAAIVVGSIAFFPVNSHRTFFFVTQRLHSNCIFHREYFAPILATNYYHDLFIILH